jgi:hypothetical protein
MCYNVEDVEVNEEVCLLQSFRFTSKMYFYNL